MISISTSWFNEDEQSIGDWLKQVHQFGYDAVELSYKVTHDQLEEARKTLSNLDLKVSSIHNFCPTPNDEPSPRHPSNYYRLSSQDEHERNQAIKWTNIAIDTAKDLNASVVVIHAGTLDFEDERSPYLFELFSTGMNGSPEFIEERNRILSLREENKAPFLQALGNSLSEVVAYARKKDVKIGLETRYYPIEIPNFEEIGYYLDMFGEDAMGYWHDVGHAEINERLGIRSHAEFLEAYQKRLIGVHIHGMEGRRDHLAPFEGDLKLDHYLPFFTEDIIKVVESKPFANPELIKEAVQKLS